MSNVFSIHSVGHSLVTYLRNTYPEPQGIPCSFRLASSNDLDNEDGPFADTNTLSLFLYRVTRNEHLRNSPRLDSLNDASIPLAIDLHYLVTVWAAQVLHEQTILAWTIRQLYLNPTLNPSSLTPEAEWGAEDIIRMTPTELSTEDMMRIWDALRPSYRLSLTYRASVIRIDADAAEEFRPVVATRFSHTDEVP